MRYHRKVAICVVLLAGCAAKKPVTIKTEIIAEPATAHITFRGRDMGTTPLILEVEQVADLMEISAQQPERKVIETRLRFLSEGHAEVVFKFGEEPTAMARALGLNAVMVFDYTEHVTFESDAYELKPELMPMLTKQAQILNAYFSTVPVYVCGHTDDTGSRDHNLELSLKRAQSVTRFLVSQNVSKERLQTQGFGEDFPVADNSSPEGRALNRRTEIVLPQ